METLRPAGKPIPFGEDSVSKCLHNNERPTTPETLKTFSHRRGPGSKTQSPLFRDYKVPVPDSFSFGIRTKASLEDSGGLLAPQISLLQQAEIERREEVYNKPQLGKPKPSKQQLPKDINNRRFGVRTNGNEDGGVDRALVWDLQHEPEPVDFTNNQYSDITFGKPTVLDANKGMNPIAHIPLQGESPKRRPRGCKDLNLPKGYVFGTAKPQHIESAREVMSGWPEESQLDMTVGKPRGSLSPIKRRPVLEETNRKSFEITAAMQSKTMLRKSIKSKLTEGNVPIATESSVVSSRGIYENEWNKPRSREELLDIVMSAGLKITYEMFDEVYEAATKSWSTSELSVDQFHRTLVDVQTKQSGLASVR